MQPQSDLRGSVFKAANCNRYCLDIESNMSFMNNVNFTPTLGFQLPLPKPLRGPVALSAIYEEALEQLRYLITAELIILDKVIFRYTNGDPTDEWIYERANERHYKSYFEDWVWAEGDIREARKNDIFCLRRLFGEEENHNEEEIHSNDVQNQKEGDTSVYWLLDYCRHIEDVRQDLPLDRNISRLLKCGRDYIIFPYSSKFNIRPLRRHRRHS